MIFYYIAFYISYKKPIGFRNSAYKKTTFLEWSFGGKRKFKWDKEKHIIDVSWKDVKVELHPNEISKSIAFIKNEENKDYLFQLKEKSLRRLNNPKLNNNRFD